MPIVSSSPTTCPSTEDELRHIGHEVLGARPNVARQLRGTDWHPSRYDPRPYIRDHRPDVCLFVSPCAWSSSSRGSSRVRLPPRPHGHHQGHPEPPHHRSRASGTIRR